MLNPDDVLVACPNCRAWPMAANIIGPKWEGLPHTLDFRCPKCGHQEVPALESEGKLTAIRARRRRRFSAPIT